MKREAFLGTLAATVPALWSRAAPCVAERARARDGFPHFSWERVPYAAEMGKIRGDFSEAEARFIAQRFAFIALGPGTGLGDKPLAERIQEVGFYRNAAAIERAGAACKVLFFWGVPCDIHNYAAYDTFDPAWRVRNPSGVGWSGDPSNPAFREWWAASAAHVVAHAGVDGVFVDGANPEGDHPHHTEMLMALRSKLDALPKPALLIVNGVPAPGRNGLPSILDLCDGIMIEYFGLIGKEQPEKQKAYMLEVMRLGKAGKIVMARAFPGFSFLDADVRTWSYERKVATARANIAYSLATYLAVAQPYAYLQYGWGYENIGGAYVLGSDASTPDPQWYPQLLRPLGKPNGDPKIDGYVFTRTFEHAAVRVDVSTHEAAVDFR